MAKSSAKKSRSRRPVIIIAILLALGLPIYAYLSFTDYRGVAFGWIIALVWYVGFFTTFFLLLIYFAQYVLPANQQESWGEGFKLLWRSIIKQFRAPGGLSNSRAKLSTALNAGENAIPTSFRLLQAGFLRSHQVAAIAKNGQFVRAAGPGFVLLKRGEYVAQLIDLRPHLGIEKIDALTSDGITINLTVSAKSQIQRPQQENPKIAHVPYKYDEKAVLLASQTGSVDDHNQTTIWSEQITPMAASYINNLISQYDLNKLLANPQILKDVNAKAKAFLERHFNGSGIEIILVGSAIKEIPMDVSEQRLRNWRAPMQRDVTIRRAEGEAEALRRIKHARARAQIEIIQAIIQNIEEMRRAEQANLNEVITLRMIEELENAMSNNTLQRMVPEQMLARLVMQTQGQMRRLLPPADEHGDES